MNEKIKKLIDEIVKLHQEAIKLEICIKCNHLQNGEDCIEECNGCCLNYECRFEPMKKNEIENIIEALNEINPHIKKNIKVVKDWNQLIKEVKDFFQDKPIEEGK